MQIFCLVQSKGENLIFLSIKSYICIDLKEKYTPKTWIETVDRNGWILDADFYISSRYRVKIWLFKMSKVITTGRLQGSKSDNHAFHSCFFFNWFDFAQPFWYALPAKLKKQWIFVLFGHLTLLKSSIGSTSCVLFCHLVLAHIIHNE